MKTGAALPRHKDAAVVDFIIERDGTGWISTSIEEFILAPLTRESLSGGIGLADAIMKNKDAGAR